MAPCRHHTPSLPGSAKGVRRCFESCYNYISNRSNNSNNNSLGHVATRAGLWEGREEREQRPFSHTSLPWSQMLVVIPGPSQAQLFHLAPDSHREGWRGWVGGRA